MRLYKQGTIFGLVAATILGIAGCGSPSASTNTGSTSSTTTSSGGAKTVTIGYVSWDEDVAASYLWKYLLEKKGYKVSMDLLGPGPIWEGMAKGDLDVFFDSWMPYVDKPYEQKYGDQLTTINTWYGGVTKEGFVVPDYMNVKTISDLKKVAGSVHGQIVGIEAGSTEMSQAQQAIQTYNLPFQVTASSTPAMLSALQKAYTAHQPIVVTLWSPHWAFTKYHLHYIADPKQVFGKPGKIQTVTNKSWADSHSEAVSWFKNFHLSEQQLGKLEEDIAADKNDPTKGVTTWVAANQGLVNQWLKS